jgi:2-oxoglutarate dehydrogenase E1 component
MSEQSLYQQLQESSALNGANAAYIEDLFEQYMLDKNSVDAEWQDYFCSLQDSAAISLGEVRERFAQLGKQPVFAASASSENIIEHKQLQVANLINSFRALGHRNAKIDPLDLQVHSEIPELTLQYHGLSNSDLNTEFDAGGVAGLNRASLQQILTTLKETYCGSIGAEIMQIADTTKREWLLKRFEAIKGKPNLAKNEQLRILEKLAATDGLEKYLGTKYVGQKRFSIEGADSIIPMMDALTLSGAQKGVQEIVVGMAHRGRLNMLINFLGKAPADLFDEFEGKKDEDRSGDVKYHKGFSSNVTTPHGMVHLAMAYNPSHLEIVDPVVEGSVRAKQWRRGDDARQEVLPVLLHGDAAFSSQGVIQETFNMSQVPGYTTGGTIHIVLNNQVGFTTPAEQGRSTLYCTDIAKMVDAPIFHVNGDDPEACVFALKLLYEYRYEFNCDVVIDLVCYRRHGHQEVDEPSMTQPLMYKVIKKHLTPHKIYAQQLVQQGVIEPGDVTKIEKAYRRALDSGQAVVDLEKKIKRNAKHKFSVDWKSYNITDWRHTTKTSVSEKTLQSLAEKCIVSLEKFPLQPQVAKIIANRTKMAAGEIPFDWGFAETLAYASLLIEGYPVRISGEDVQRGTFGHRHAVLHNFEDGEVYIPLRHLAEKQANISIYNSILSEEGVLGFEVGYAAAAPDTLVIWEAQFGDFANGAQVLVDQFLSSGEQKWGQKSGLAMFLPHGYEGQGPEHSSARLERYLQLCAQHNMQV